MTSSLIASAMLRDPLYHIECLTAPSYTKYLISSCVLNRLLHHLQGAHLPAQAGNLLLQPDRLGLGEIALFAVGSVQRSQVTRDAGVDLLRPPDDLGDRVIFVAIVHRFELTAVDRNNGAGEQAQLAAQHHKLGT